MTVSKSDSGDEGARFGALSGTRASSNEPPHGTDAAGAISLTPKHPIFQSMVGHLSRVTVEVFESYAIAISRKEGVQATLTTSSTDPAAVAAIGFTGQGVRGTLVMIALESAIRGWLAQMGVHYGVEPVDALGEFSNMLLGRLKTRLLHEGLCFQVATPTTTLGCGLRVSLPPAQSAWLSFKGRDFDLRVRLDAQFEPGFALEPAFEPPLEPGAAIVF